MVYASLNCKIVKLSHYDPFLQQSSLLSGKMTPMSQPRRLIFERFLFCDANYTRLCAGSE